MSDCYRCKHEGWEHHICMVCYDDMCAGLTKKDKSILNLRNELTKCRDKLKLWGEWSDKVRRVTGADKHTDELRWQALEKHKELSSDESYSQTMRFIEDAIQAYNPNRKGGP